MVDDAGQLPQPAGPNEAPDASGAAPVFAQEEGGAPWDDGAIDRLVAEMAQDAQGTPAGPLAGANAPAEGVGGDSSGAASAEPAGKAAKPEKAAKVEKTIDWGKFNHLVEHFALIYGTDTVWDGGQRMIMKLANMAHAHGADMVRLWKGSERRRTVLPTDVVFDPTGEADPVSKINLFDGIAMEPVDGDVQPVLDLVRYLTSRTSDNADEADENMHWLLCWLAYPLQHMGAKMRTAIVMHGDEGAGKNFLFDIWVAIFGKYGAMVGQDELEDKFNDWRSCKLAVVGDEVSSRQELVHNKNRLKALITTPTVQINPKNMPRREEKNHMNVVFLSNEITPLALDNSDRRYFVVYTPRAKDHGYYRALGEWRDNGGIAAFYAYLLAYPLGDFNPYTPAPQTQAKRDLIDINRKSPEQFWLVWQAGEIDLPYHPCSCAQAYRAYLKWCQRTGERFPLKQNLFTRMVLRISEAEGSQCWEKVMAPKDEHGVKKAERMLLTVPPPDKDQGVWATECREAFEKALRTYMGGGFPHSPGSNDNGDE
jgi:putative DNA primase/helicase